VEPLSFKLRQQIKALVDDREHRVNTQRSSKRRQKSTPKKSDDLIHTFNMRQYRQHHKRTRSRTMKDNFLGFTEIIFLAYWLLTRTGFEIRESSIETGL